MKYEKEIDDILKVTRQLRETYPKETQLIFVFNNNTFDIKFIKNDDFLYRLHYVMEANNIRVMPVCEAVFDLDINFSENEILDDKFIVLLNLKK